MNFSAEEISRRLKRSYDPNFPPECPYPPNLLIPIEQSGFQNAAVLLPFLHKDGEWQILFIRRTKKSNDRHSGQVAFPGGRCETRDPDAFHAALREACEETGIRPADVHYLGRIRDLITITKYQITPIVGLIPWPYPVIPQREEVSRIFTIPLQWLADPTNRSVQKKRIQAKTQDIPVVYFKSYDGETLWGASARITLLLLEALGLANPRRRYL